MERYIDGLHYDSRNLYSGEPSLYPPRPAIYGLNKHPEQRYIIFFAKDEDGWHFRLAPTKEAAGRGTIVMDEKAFRLIDAPAGMVLHWSEEIERTAVDILEGVAALLAASYSSPSAPARKSTPPPAPPPPPSKGSGSTAKRVLN